MMPCTGTRLMHSTWGCFQETGRAGRDGKPSTCILFYTFADVKSLRKLIDCQDNVSWEQKRAHKELLSQVIGYCENKIDCRRRLVLQYFNEDFPKSECNNTCDNCLNNVGHHHIELDVTEHARNVVAMVRAAVASNIGKITTKQFVEAYYGSKSKMVSFNGYLRLDVTDPSERERKLSLSPCPGDRQGLRQPAAVRQWQQPHEEHYRKAVEQDASRAAPIRGHCSQCRPVGSCLSRRKSAGSLGEQLHPRTRLSEMSYLLYSSALKSTPSTTAAEGLCCTLKLPMAVPIVKPQVQR